jgi:hypothetical protein
MQVPACKYMRKQVLAQFFFKYSFEKEGKFRKCCVWKGGDNQKLLSRLRSMEHSTFSL